MDNIFFNLMEYAVLSSTIRILILFRGVCLICGNENFVKPALDSNDQFGGADVVVFLIFPSKVRGSAPSTPTPATLRTFTDEQTNVSSESCELPCDSSESLSKVENEQRLVFELVLVSLSSNSRRIRVLKFLQGGCGVGWGKMQGKSQNCQLTCIFYTRISQPSRYLYHFHNSLTVFLNSILQIWVHVNDDFFSPNSHYCEFREKNEDLKTKTSWYLYQYGHSMPSTSAYLPCPQLLAAL